MGRGVVRSSLLLFLSMAGLTASAFGQVQRSGQEVSVVAQKPAAVGEWDARLTAMVMAGELQRINAESETIAPRWFHERFQQRYRGLRVFGNHLIRHWQDGRVVLVNGRYHSDIGVNTTPAIGPAEARLAAEGADSSGTGRVVNSPELLIYPSAKGLILAYKLHLRTESDLILFFISGENGKVVDQWSDLRTQTSAVGEGTGTWGDTKKVSAAMWSGTYHAADVLRPAVSYTVDVMGLYPQWATYQIDPTIFSAIDSDNRWADGAVVDAHVYSGWTYDYYYQRFGRRGINGADM